MPRNSPGYLERMLESGELHELARGCDTQGELAEKVGITGKAYSLARGKVVRAGRYFPSFEELKSGHSLTDGDLPKNHYVKGVSTLYDSEGEIKQQWVKTNTNAEQTHQALLESLESLSEPWKGKHDPIPGPAASDDDLLCVYPMGDPHLGMYSWFEETGANFDLEIAESNLVSAVDHLVSLAPNASRALIIDLGDFFHADNHSNRTMRSGNPLDVDSRWSKVLRVGIRAMRRLIDRALEKHGLVHVIIEIGNHDDHSSLMLAIVLSQYYERDERVTVDTSPAKFHWYRFGDCLIGVTHGDTVKADKLPGVMAFDKAKDWGETTHRHWYCGHVHHDSTKEYPGVTIETLRTLAPRDAWHAAAGYRSGQDMKLDVWHRKHGMINRHIVGIRQIWANTGGDR